MSGSYSDTYVQLSFVKVAGADSFTLNVSSPDRFVALNGMSIVSTPSQPSSGTVIMISSISGWIVFLLSFVFWKEIKRTRIRRG